MRVHRWLLPLVVLATAAGCASGKKKTAPELSELEGRKVALVEIDGEATARGVVEVALINQLLKRGTFILVSKQDVEKARDAHDQDTTDYKGIAERAGAEVALKAKVLEFDADTREGYSSETVEDSQMEAETGNGKTERLYKVKAMHGKVKVELTFFDLKAKENAERVGIAEADDKVEAESKTSAARLPPKLRFLEKVANEAFRKFFERYN